MYRKCSVPSTCLWTGTWKRTHLWNSTGPEKWQFLVVYHSNNPLTGRRLLAQALHQWILSPCQHYPSVHSVSIRRMRQGHNARPLVMIVPETLPLTFQGLEVCLLCPPYGSGQTVTKCQPRDTEGGHWLVPSFVQLLGYKYFNKTTKLMWSRLLTLWEVSSVISDS